jgi:hypothetical protein
MSNLKNSEEYNQISTSCEYYKKNRFIHKFLYKEINSIFPFMFKNKIKEFHYKSEAYLADQDLKFEIFKKRITMELATDNFTTNSFGHYNFNIDGVNHVFGIVSIHSLFDEANRIKSELANKPKMKSSKILQFKK